jgi:NADPH:quinone reductase-like Zn-dependent oxidoreductase
MQTRIEVEQFGDESVLQVRKEPVPEPGAGEVRIGVTSIGMNHADLMARRGEYRLASGDPPFTPGLEAGGYVEAAGEGVDPELVGKRVTLGVDIPRPATGRGGTYRSCYITRAQDVVIAPDAIPDDQLGTLWLPFLTAWGCLVWKQQITPGQVVAFPAATSSVALAGSQVARRQGAVTVGLTSHASKVAVLESIPEAHYDHLVVTHDADHKMMSWHKQLRKITSNHGVDVFFDPVASGAYLDMEIKSLAQEGTIWVYGLLGSPGTVDVSPLIRKHAAIRGWLLGEVAEAGEQVLSNGYKNIMDGFASGDYRQHMAETFALEDVQHAHNEMAKGKHIGKMALIPR